ncbi:MAG: ATP phosphoribosyltransferase [Oscillospiraceae bacterium]|jgi:ATP phosphoribosyltransferase|nr:ATP phosphoribosyltransferase [Oscillospiraceae bacterium]
MSITLAVAKGRLAEDLLTKLIDAGIDCADALNPGRRLIVPSADGSISFIFVKPSDVPTYVERGVADAGVCGKDTLLEENKPLLEMLDLGFGKCRLCICGKQEMHEAGLRSSAYRVATKYPRIARALFERRYVNAEIIELHGSVELAPLVGLSDVILDIVESGGTLFANGLSIIEEIYPISARLVVNRVSLKTRSDEIKRLLDALKEAV